MCTSIHQLIEYHSQNNGGLACRLKSVEIRKITLKAARFIHASENVCNISIHLASFCKVSFFYLDYMTTWYYYIKRYLKLQPQVLSDPVEDVKQYKASYEKRLTQFYPYAIQSARRKSKRYFVFCTKTADLAPAWSEAPVLASPCGRPRSP